MAKKEVKEDKPAGSPAWMATFSDLVTLLMCFFVLLYAMSDVNEEKFRAIADSFSSSLVVLQLGGGEGITELYSSGIIDMPILQESIENIDSFREEIAELESNLNQFLLENGLSDSVNIQQTENGFLKLTFSSSILFDVARDEIRVDAVPILEKVANEILNYTNNDIMIIGHTDSDPIRTVRFPSNWHLSSARAISVGLFFIDKGIETTRIWATGRGEYMPVAPNDTEENKAKNRRVEILIISQHFSNNFIS